MAVKFFESKEQFIIGIFDKIIPIGENWINKETFISLGFHLRNQRSITLFRDLYTFAVQ